MQWSKIITINLTIIYLAYKLYGLMWFLLTESNIDKSLNINNKKFEIENFFNFFSKIYEDYENMKVS